MTVTGYLPYAAAVWVFMIGLYGIVTSRNLIHLITCLSVVQSATYILILAVGYRTGAAAPVFADQPVNTPAVDPVVHALALTDIVVAATVTALLIALTMQVYGERGTLDPNELRPMRD